MGLADGEKVVLKDYVHKKQKTDVANLENEIEDTQGKISYAENYNQKLQQQIDELLAQQKGFLEREFA